MLAFGFAFGGEIPVILRTFAAKRITNHYLWLFARLSIINFYKRSALIFPAVLPLKQGINVRFFTNACCKKLQQNF
jgi:hypothetical protein